MCTGGCAPTVLPTLPTYMNGENRTMPLLQRDVESNNNLAVHGTVVSVFIVCVM